MASPTVPSALAAEDHDYEGGVAQSVRTIKAYLDQLKQFLPATGVCYADIGRKHFDDFLVMLDRGEDCIRRVYAPEYAPEHVPKRAKCAAPADQAMVDRLLRATMDKVFSDESDPAKIDEYMAQVAKDQDLALERSEKPSSSGSALDDVLKVAVAGAMSEA